MEIVIKRGNGYLALVLILLFPSWRRKMEIEWICSSANKTKHNSIFEKIK